MGEAERMDPDLRELISVAEHLSPQRRAELVDFASYLASREAREKALSVLDDEGALSPEFVAKLDQAKHEAASGDVVSWDEAWQAVANEP